MHVPAYAWILSLVVGIAFSWWAYRFLWPKNHLWKLAAILRAAAVALVVLWLFDPIVNFVDTQTKPAQWDVYVDVSNSTRADSQELQNFLDTLKVEFKSPNIRVFAFAEGLVPYANKHTLGGNLTRLDHVLTHMQANKSQTDLRWIFSDGIVNQGRMPQSFELADIGPIAAVGIGNTTLYLDLSVNELLANDEVFQGNTTDIEATIEALASKGKSLNIELWVNEVLQEQQTWIPDSERSKKKVGYTLKTSGQSNDYLKAVVKVKPAAGERNVANNQQSVLIKILDQRKIIDFVYAGPHPDIKALQLALADKEAYTLRVYSESEGLKKDADAYIAHGIRSKATLDLLSNTAKPIWWFASNRESLQTVFDAEETAAVRRGLSGFQETVPAWNSEFQLFEIPNANREKTLWNAVESPLLAIKSPSEEVQMYQVWSGTQTNVPLMISRKTKRAEHLFLGWGIWRWRMNEFRKNGNSKLFDAWVVRNIQWLLRANYGKSGWEFVRPEGIVNLGYSKKLKWICYDEAGEKKVAEGVEAYVENMNKKAVKLNLVIDNDEYMCIWNPEFSGLNKLVLRNAQGEVLREGFIDVVENTIEDMQKQAQHGVLAEIANKSSGIFGDFRGNRSEYLTKIKKMELDKPGIIMREEGLPFERWPVILMVMVGLLSIEWFLRKWLGKI